MSDSLGPDDDEVTRLTDPIVMRAQTRIGQVVKEKWRLDVLLGVGGMAAVYAATHRNGSRAAIKLLHPELSTNHDVHARFLREGYVANAVGHEGAARVIDDDVAEDGAAFLVMDLLDGETLEDRRVRCGGQLDEDDVLSATDQLLDVLIAAHSNGVIHRDIKPENVFVTRGGQVKVLDFGIARLHGTKSTATLSGAAMGTPAFMSPEQARGLWDEVDGQSDLWAVGATMFSLLSGRLVHEGRSTNEQLLHAMTKEPAPLESILPNATAAVCQLVNRALVFDKEQRWPNATRMQEAVRHAYHDRFGKPITTSPRLAVPESVPNRTSNVPQPIVPVVPRPPTTDQAVARSRTATTVPSRLARSTLTAVFAGVATIVVALSAAVWTASTAHMGTATIVSMPRPVLVMTVPAAVMEEPVPVMAEPVTIWALPPATSSAPTDPGPPLIAATDLPTAATPPPPAPLVAQSPAPASRTAPQAASHPSNDVPSAVPATSVPDDLSRNPYRVTASCDPPYTFDSATGHKHFKSECLGPDSNPYSEQRE